MTKTLHPTRWLLVLVAIFMILPGLSANEQDRELRYDKLVARYLGVFPKYVTWPKESFQNARSPIVIGVVGDERFGRRVEKTVGKKIVRDRPFKVERIRGIDFRTPTQIDVFKVRLMRCHVIYISRSESKRVSRILGLLTESRALTVSDTEDFAKNGGMIQIVASGERTSLHIHRTPTNRAGLELDSQLLKLAEKVYPDRK